MIADGCGFFLYFRKFKIYRIDNEKLQGIIKECHDVYI